MSHHDTSHENARPFELSKIGPGATLAGLVLVLIALGTMASPEMRKPMLQSYLFGWVFWMTMACGCFGITLLHHTVRGTWGLPILRMVESGGSARTFLTLGVLFTPILVFMQDLYYWSQPAKVAADPVLQHKLPYLNPAGFAWRAVIFIGVMAWMAYGLRKSTRRQDESKLFKEEQTRTNYAAPGLVLFGLIMTFAFTDWVMSLDPHWFSTIWGVLFMVGSGAAALSFAVMLLGANHDRKPFAEVMSPALTRDLGNLLFVFTMLWGYVHLSQYLIIWSGNLPEFTTYFFYRSQGGWNMVGAALIVGQFFFPFIALLVPRVKRDPMLLARVAGWLFVMRIFDIYNFVVPFFRPTPVPVWMDVVAFLGLGGVWLAIFAREMAGAPILPQYDRRLQEALEHAH
jgi:hypothetical protein